MTKNPETLRLAANLIIYSLIELVKIYLLVKVLKSIDKIKNSK